MSNKAALQELEGLIYSTLSPAPTKVYRRTQTDVLNLIDELQKAKAELPIVVLVTGRVEPDTALSDAMTDLRAEVDVYFIRPRALSAGERTGGYSRIEDWADDFVVQVRDLLYYAWDTPLLVEEPHIDVTSANPANTLLLSQLPQWYAVGCGAEYVVAVG